MRFIVILFILLSSSTYGQNVVNNDSLLHYFRLILNDYRITSGLHPLIVDEKIKPFTDDWVEYMSTNGVVHHGTDDKSFQNRAKNFFSKDIYCVENCCTITTPSSLSDVTVNCPIVELIPIIRKTYDGTANQFDYAYFTFILWKSSPDHNRALLDPNVKKFYLSSSPSKDVTYVEFVGTN